MASLQPGDLRGLLDGSLGERRGALFDRDLIDRRRGWIEVRGRAVLLFGLHLNLKRHDRGFITMPRSAVTER